MALADTFVRQVKHSGKASGDKYADGGGMYLLVKASGRYWRMDYTHADKRKTLALLIRPCEVLSRVANVTILEVANNALRVLLQHRHVIIGSLA